MNSHFIYGYHTVKTHLELEPTNMTRIWIQSTKNPMTMQYISDMARQNNISVIQSSHQYLKKLCHTTKHQGIIAECIGETLFLQENEIIPHLQKQHKQSPLLLILDCIQDPHNFGSCLRSAEASGVDMVIVPKDKQAPLSAAAKKASAGAYQLVQLAIATNLARIIRQLQYADFWIYGLAGETSSSLYVHDLTGAIAFIVGSEGKGIRPNIKKQCDHLIKLPMAGQIASLNVSVATGIALYEALRQRGY